MNEVKIRLQYRGLARNLTGRASEEITLIPDASVHEVLETLIEKYGDEFRTALMTTDGRLRRFVRIMLGPRNAIGTGDLNTKIADGLDVSIIIMVDPIVGG